MEGPQLSEVEVTEFGKLCERVDFGNEIVLYPIDGVTEHRIYGIFFSFGKAKSEE